MVQFDKAFFMKLCWACLFKSGVYMPKVRLIPFKSAQVRSNPYAIRQRIGIASGTARDSFETASRQLRLGFDWASGKIRVRFGKEPNNGRTAGEAIPTMFRPCPEAAPNQGQRCADQSPKHLVHAENLKKHKQ